MATAVETSSQPKTPNPPANLLVASMLGAVYVVAALAVVFYAVPQVWAQYAAPYLSGFSLVAVALRVVVQLAVLVGLVWFGSSLVGANPPKGLRGGVFLMLVAAAIIFFVVRAIGLWAEGVMATTAAMVVAGIVLLALLFVAYRFFTSPRGERWMVGLEEQGWFHATGYKRALGQKVRRLTILGLLLIGGTGVYSLMFASTLPKDWTIALPFTQKADGSGHQTFTILTDTQYSVPLILMGLTLWVAYRAVNMPSFAEFLIATEAEMNKVSWTPRRRLVQDTAVVLITTLLMTLFLLAVDLFWGWLLSRETVGVLPGSPTGQDKAGQVQEAKW